MPLGYTDDVFNTPNTPDILESKIISAMHVYKIINDYDSSKNQDNKVISGICKYFDIDCVKKLLSVIPIFPPFSCAFKMDNRSAGQCYCLFHLPPRDGVISLVWVIVMVVVEFRSEKLQCYISAWNMCTLCSS